MRSGMGRDIPMVISCGIVYEIRAYLSTVAGITCTNMYTKRSGKCAILCDTLLRSLKGVFGSSMGASEPGLVDFVNAGGKIITYHNLADSSITPKQHTPLLQRSELIRRQRH
ncbi:hypothetical protein ACMFMF_011279 [Clarireedia jacksonii]